MFSSLFQQKKLGKIRELKTKISVVVTWGIVILVSQDWKVCVPSCSLKNCKSEIIKCTMHIHKQPNSAKLCMSIGVSLTISLNKDYSLKITSIKLTAIVAAVYLNFSHTF